MSNISIPNNWKPAAPQDPGRQIDGVTIGVIRNPTVQNLVGYELQTCIHPGQQSFTLGACQAPGYTGYSGLPNTAFAVDSAYRFTMSQLAPYLLDLERRIKLLEAKP